MANDMCFACGPKNPIGLKLKFGWQGAEYGSKLEILEQYQGWAGIAHGGILSTALDEVMARLVIDTGHQAITARLEVRFIKPARVGETIALRARITRERGRLIETEARALAADGAVIAEAKATSLCV